MIIQFLASLLLPFLGYSLGLRAKKPVIVADAIQIDSDNTYIYLNNIGESTAVNIQIGQALLDMSGVSVSDPFHNWKISFVFEKAAYIEPQKPKKVSVTTLINGKEKSDGARRLFSHALKRFKYLEVTYSDNFGTTYKSKLTDIPIK